jgi:glycopeptide antibiotics resistance protein
MYETKKAILLLLIIYIVFIIYSTTLPYDFTADPEVLRHTLHTIRWKPFIRLDGRRESIPDIVSNILLFFPLGLLLGYAACQAQRKWRRWSIPLIALAGSALLSGAVETAQLLSATRITSITDLLTNSAGGLLGAGLSVLFYLKLKEPLVSWGRRQALRSPLTLLTVVYAVFLILAFTIPLDLSLDVSSIKQGIKSAILDPIADPTPPVKMVSNFLWFAGLGFLLSRLFDRRSSARRSSSIRSRKGMFLPALAAIVCAGALAVLLELLQVFIISRVATTRDALVGLAGAVYAALLFLILPFSASDQRRGAAESTRPRRHDTVLSLVLFHYGLFLVHTALYPYVYHLPHDLLASARKALVPFSSYYGHTNTLALFDFLGGIARFAPLGFLLPGRGPSTAERGPWRSIIICALAGLVLEALQLGVAGRFADSSDFIAAGCGGYVGWLIWQWWRSRWSPGAGDGGPDGQEKTSAERIPGRSAAR